MAFTSGRQPTGAAEMEQSSVFILLQKEWMVANCVVALFFLAVSGGISKILVVHKSASIFERLPTRDKLLTVIHLTVFLTKSLVALPFTLAAFDVTFNENPLEAVVGTRYRIVYGLNILSISFLVRYFVLKQLLIILCLNVLECVEGLRHDSRRTAAQVN